MAKTAEVKDTNISEVDVEEKNTLARNEESKKSLSSKENVSNTKVSGTISPLEQPSRVNNAKRSATSSTVTTREMKSREGHSFYSSAHTTANSSLKPGQIKQSMGSKVAPKNKMPIKEDQFSMVTCSTRQQLSRIVSAQKQESTTASSKRGEKLKENGSATYPPAHSQKKFPARQREFGVASSSGLKSCREEGTSQLPSSRGWSFTGSSGKKMTVAPLQKTNSMHSGQDKSRWGRVNSATVAIYYNRSRNTSALHQKSGYKKKRIPKPEPPAASLQDSEDSNEADKAIPDDVESNEVDEVMPNGVGSNEVSTVKTLTQDLPTDEVMSNGMESNEADGDDEVIPNDKHPETEVIGTTEAPTETKPDNDISGEKEEEPAAEVATVQVVEDLETGIPQYVFNIALEIGRGVHDLWSLAKELEYMQKKMEKAKECCKKFLDDIDLHMDELVAQGEKCITSIQHLRDAEVKVFEDKSDMYRVEDVVVEREDDKVVTIHTIIFDQKRKSNPEKIPLVMVHGLGGGLPCFHHNYTDLCEERMVYGIDLPGFALSSRIKFPKSALECRDRVISLLDKWREAMKIDKFILLGHSFGGHLSAAYTVKYHKHVRHLVLADAWGIIPKEEDRTRKDPKLWERAAMAMSNLLKSNPFDAVRILGPYGKELADKFVSEEVRNSYGIDCVNYFYHAMAQCPATGEGVFSVLSGYEYIWPEDPMKDHLIQLPTTVPLTFMYGGKSPFKNECGKEIKKRRRMNTFVIDPFPDIGHHVQAQDAGLFNKKVRDILSRVDNNSDTCREET